MLVKEAKEIARQWVSEQGRETPEFHGAFFHGSVNWLADDANLSGTSDLDVMVVVAGPPPPNKLGKFHYHDLLLEVSYLSIDQLQSPEQVLGNYHLAGSFRGASVISDPSGRLTELQRVVSRNYATRFWVRKRCEDAQNNLLRFLQRPSTPVSFPDQVSAWLFANGVMTHVLLVAGLKNPTVRRRYLAARELLADYNHLPFYETLLEMLGCARMSGEIAGQHLAALAEAFDAAASVLRTPYRFAADFRESARPIVIEGSQELIERGFHREAVFWILATYSRCQWVLQQDGTPEMQQRYDIGYRSLLADLGITTVADLHQRGEQVRAFLPSLWTVAESILDSNPEIDHAANPDQSRPGLSLGGRGMGNRRKLRYHRPSLGPL